jgi:hypothetical protein
MRNLKEGTLLQTLENKETCHLHRGGGTPSQHRRKLKTRGSPFATPRGLIQFCIAHPQQFRNVFFGPESRNGVRAGQYINDIGAPLFGRFVKLFFDVAKDEGLPNRDDIVVAHTWWFTIFGLATLMVIQGVVPDLPDQTLVVEQTIATLWAGVQAVPRLPQSAITKRSSVSKQ